MHIKLRLIYALHMILPLRLAHWHIERLDADTVRALARLFPA